MSLVPQSPDPLTPLSRLAQMANPLPAGAIVDIPVLPLAEEDIGDAIPAPKPPHPGFWMSVLWCIVFLSVTQTPGAVVAGVEMAVGFAFAPQQQSSQKPVDVQKGEHDSPPTLSAKPPQPVQKANDVKQTISGIFQSDVVRSSLIHALAITEICVVLFSWGMIRLLVGRDWKRKLALRRPGLAHSAMAIVGLPALWILGVGLYVIAKQTLHIPGMEDLLKYAGMGDANIPLMEELMNSIRQWPLPIAVLIIGLGPGIGEELWCRGFLGRGLVGRYGVVAGIAMTSFFFGLIHLDPAQGLMAMMMGVCLHFVYQTTRSLWLSILLHFLNNSVSVVILRFPELDVIEKHPELFLPLFVGAMVLAAAIAYAFYQSRARLVPETPGAKFCWRPDYSGVEYPPPGSGTTVAHPAPSILAISGVATGFIFLVVSCFWL